jgi:hypothetical protein
VFGEAAVNAALAAVWQYDLSSGRTGRWLEQSIADVSHARSVISRDLCEPGAWRIEAHRELERRSVDTWFGGALSAVTCGYRWSEVRPGGAGAARTLLAAEGSAVSLRGWPGIGGAVAGLAVAVAVLPYALSEAWARDCYPELGRYISGIWLTMLGPASPSELVVICTAWVRLVDIVLVSLRLMLVRVLFVLSRLVCAVAFVLVLVLVAVRLRCGCPSEPDDCAFLLSRRYQTWSGSAPAVS